MRHARRLIIDLWNSSKWTSWAERSELKISRRTRKDLLFVAYVPGYIHRIPGVLHQKVGVNYKKRAQKYNKETTPDLPRRLTPKSNCLSFLFCSLFYLTIYSSTDCPVLTHSILRTYVHLPDHWRIRLYHNRVYHSSHSPTSTTHLPT